MTSRERTTVDELLSRSPLWKALPAAARAELVARATRRSFRAKQRLVAAGDRSVVTLIVGRADLVSPGVGRDAEPVVIRSIVPPATIGISVALGGPPTAELWAREAGALVSVPGEAFAATIKRHPDAAIAAMIHLAGVVADLSGVVDVMRRHGLTERVRHALTELSAGRRELAITHEQLAAGVGGSRANITRALARLEKQGFLRRHHGRIELR
jgi:CRP-like cAMP-binding protein